MNYYCNLKSAGMGMIWSKVALELALSLGLLQERFRFIAVLHQDLVGKGLGIFLDSACTAWLHFLTPGEHSISVWTISLS